MRAGGGGRESSRRAGRVLVYAVGVSRPVWEYDPPLHVASAPGTLEFPWSRGEASAPEHAEAFGAELGEALLAAMDGGTAGAAQAQARWYGLPSGLPSGLAWSLSRREGTAGSGSIRARSKRGRP